MNLNFLSMLFNIQENPSILLEGSSSFIETEQISMWQLIWGYDSISGEYSMTSLIVMSLLFIFSFTAIYVFIERLMTIQKALKGKKDFMQKINDFVLEGNLNGAKEHCKSSHNPIARMIEKGLKRQKIMSLDIMGYWLYFLNKIFFKEEVFPSNFKIFVWDKIFTPITILFDFLFRYKFGKCILAIYKKN